MNFLPLQIQIPIMPEQASSIAAEVDLFYYALIGLTVFFTLVVAIPATLFMIMYRRKSAGHVPEPVHGALLLEIGWSVIPFVLAMGIFAWGAKLYYQMYAEPKDALEIFVTGKQWMWRAQHVDGIREINALHMPVGRTIKLTMTSEDVIHSYFIPAFRTKTDVVPGRYTTTTFKPIKTGEYHLFCTEYCGTQHSGMIGTVYVMEADEYQKWLSTGGGIADPSASPAEIGKKVFENLACNSCHKEDNSGRAPSLVGVYGTQVKLANGASVMVDEDYIRESVLNPRAKTVGGFEQIMPTYHGQLNEEQIMQVINYVKSIGGNPNVSSAKVGLATGTAVTAAQPATVATPVPAPAAPVPAAVPAKPAVAKPVTPGAKPVN